MANLCQGCGAIVGGELRLCARCLDPNRDCQCACCEEHRRAIAHGRDGMACHCNIYDEDERCDCTFCRSWLERTERCEQCGAVVNGFHMHVRPVGEGN